MKQKFKRKFQAVRDALMLKGFLNCHLMPLRYRQITYISSTISHHSQLYILFYELTPSVTISVHIKKSWLKNPWDPPYIFLSWNYCNENTQLYSLQAFQKKDFFKGWFQPQKVSAQHYFISSLAHFYQCPPESSSITISLRRSTTFPYDPKVTLQLSAQLLGGVSLSWVNTLIMK